MTDGKLRQVPVLTVNQWMPGWDKIDFDDAEHRAKPQRFFYIFSLPARELRSLSGIVRRIAKDAGPRTDDLGIQRQHDPERSGEISRFVQYGYPWSTLNESKRASSEFNDLRKPGWLPTAVVINILPKGSVRNGSRVADSDVVTVVTGGGQSKLQLPYEEWSGDWSPTALPPFEVIDGQHRLWAFDEASNLDGFELPVVAFCGLDISWQAYLFWTINIKPKKINPSLAFDLYPLLRNEDWLDRAEGHSIYREARAQELTEILWSYPESPWYDRINMLGERGSRWVTQSAWIKSLVASFIRPWDTRAGGTGGLYGGRSKNADEVLGWSRAQQAAFLIYAWSELKSAISGTDNTWAQDLRRHNDPDITALLFPDGSIDTSEDMAFYSSYTLICTDQGVRGFLQVVNDLCYIRAPHLKLNMWKPDSESAANPIEGVSTALSSLGLQAFTQFVRDACASLASFDWRTSSAPDLDDATRRGKLVFRGSSGYRELRMQLLEHVAASAGEVGDAAKRLLGRT